MFLYTAVSESLFKCLGEPPKISVVDNQKQGYVLKIRKKSAKKCCNCCCVRNLSKNHNLQITEDERYLTIHSPYDITSNLEGRLDAEVSGASSLQYLGDPTMGDINTSGASTINKK